MANAHLARVVVWARGLFGMLLAVGLLAEPVFAQCPPVAVTGSVATGDGSIPVGPAGVNSVPACPLYSVPGGIPGSITIKCFPGVPPYGQGSSSYTFQGGASFYFPEAGGSATCSRDANECIQCSGSFSFVFYSTEAALEGSVTYFPDGAPAPFAQVAAVALDGGITTTTVADANGRYKFLNPSTPNNWGLVVRRPPGASGAGSATYRAYAVQDHYIDVPLTSNQMGHADLIAPRTDGEEPPRCNTASGGSPGPSAGQSAMSTPAAPTPPCTVGCPVSVTTGNVDIDQTDAVVPGLGLGLLFTRSYNSANSAVPERSGVFGPGWNHSYEKRLTFPWAGTIKLRNSDGTITYFVGSDAAGYDQTNPYSKDSRIVRTPSSNVYVRSFERGGQEVYDRLTPSGNCPSGKSGRCGR